MSDLGHKAVVHTVRTQSGEQVGQTRTISDFIGYERSVKIGPKSNPILTKAVHKMVKVSEHDVKLKL